MKVSEEKTLTLLIGGNSQLFYYNGMFTGQVSETNYRELRNLIITRKLEIKKRFRSGDLVVLIKSSNEASYKNVIDCLDEMIINDVRTYMLLDILLTETKTLEEYRVTEIQ